MMPAFGRCDPGEILVGKSGVFINTDVDLQLSGFSPIQVDVMLDVRLSCEAGSSSVMTIAGRRLVSEFHVQLSEYM